MKIGCHLPMYGPVGTRDNVLAFARRIEALGYDSLWASDHVVLPHRMTTPYPYSPTGQFPLAPDVPFPGSGRGAPCAALAIFSFDAVGAFPKPVRGDIPILIGGHTPRALRRVVQHGDGWHAAFITPAALKADLARLKDECARQRRPYEQLAISVRAGLSIRQSPLGPDRNPLQGSHDQILADLTAFRDLGVESILLETRYRDLAEMLAIYETFARDLRPQI
jgi:alkanesulfonate monooxygenase SsuD/methylene tetrahydromethanopterin reductase-like flavin-dependent oxidoreductase (luciferase family)